MAVDSLVCGVILPLAKSYFDWHAWLLRAKSTVSLSLSFPQLIFNTVHNNYIVTAAKAIIFETWMLQRFLVS